MAKIRNMGTSTMRFNEGVIISGSIDEQYATAEGVALICTGSLEIAANSTNNEVIRINSAGDQRELVFERAAPSGNTNLGSLHTDTSDNLVLSGAALQLNSDGDVKIYLDTSDRGGAGLRIQDQTGDEMFAFYQGGDVQFCNATQFSLKSPSNSPTLIFNQNAVNRFYIGYDHNEPSKLKMGPGGAGFSNPMIILDTSIVDVERVLILSGGGATSPNATDQ